MFFLMDKMYRVYRMGPSKYAFCFWPKFKVGGWRKGVLGLDGRLTLGTACILARDDYVDNKRPRKGRRTRGNSGLARFEVCIVRTLRGNPLSHGQIGPWNGNVANASTFLSALSWMPKPFPVFLDACLSWTWTWIQEHSLGPFIFFRWLFSR